MPGPGHPPHAKGATDREQAIIDRAFHLAEKLPDRGMVGPIREAVELIVELIEDRDSRLAFLDEWDQPTGG